MRCLVLVLAFLTVGTLAAAPLGQDDAAQIGRAADLAGLRSLIAQRDQGLLFTAVNSWARAGMRELPPQLEALIVEHYGDPVSQRPLLAFLARDLDKHQRIPKYRSRALFDRLYVDLRAGRDSLHYATCIVATDLPVEGELVALLPQLNAESANELVMLLGVRKYAPAVPALQALRSRNPRERHVNQVREHVDWALLQIGTPEAVRDVLGRLRSLGEDQDPRAPLEVWHILLSVKDLPPGSAPDYPELRAALPARLRADSWDVLVQLIALRKERRAAPELIRAIGESTNPAQAADVLLALGEPAELRAGRAALERAKGLSPAQLVLLQKRFDEGLADPAKLAAQRDQRERAQASDTALRAFGEEKSRIGRLRESEPKRYAAELRALLARYETRLPPGMAQRDYLELGGFLRFGLRDPDAAIAAFEGARRLDPDRTVDLAALFIADTQRFDKKDANAAAASYRAVLERLHATPVGAPDPRLAAALRRWLGHELAYVEHGRRFSGALGSADLELAQLWLMIASMQQPLRAPFDDRTLDALSPSQFQIARALPTLFELPPPQMLAFFAKHDPAGYLTASLLAAATARDASPFLKTAAETFFRDRGIRRSSADPRYGSPEKTWSAFLAAAKNGNAAAMLDCFTPEMQEKLGPLFRGMSREELRAVAASFVGFALGESYGEFREATVVRRQNERRVGGMMTFVNEGGSWKIASM